MFGREQEQAKYFVSRKSKLLGPYPMAELKALLRAGTIHASDTAWTQGMLKWLPVNQVAGGGAAAVTPARSIVKPAPVPERIPAAKRSPDHAAEHRPNADKRATPQELLRRHRDRQRLLTDAKAAAAPEAKAYASFRERVIAYALDALAIYLLVAAVSAELWPSIESGFDYRVQLNEEALYAPLAVLIAWLYYALLESSKLQATFGKRWMRIHVADMDGRRIAFRRASLRYWGQYLSGALGGLGFLIAAFTPRRQALHDMLAGCVILRGRPYRPTRA